MTSIEKNTAIKATVLEAVKNGSALNDAIQVGDFSFAIPVTVDGEDRYAVLDLTAKNNKDTKTTSAFNASDANAAWLAAKAESAAKAAQKKAEKDAKASKGAAKA